MSSQRANTNKPRALSCRHFCFSFDLHNYCPTCREVGREDDPRVTGEKPCTVCSLFLEEQLCKIKNGKHYTRKPKSDSSKDKVDLLGDPDMGGDFSWDPMRNLKKLLSRFTHLPLGPTFRFAGFIT